MILNVIHGKGNGYWNIIKKSIIDKINSFFGYNCISVQIKLKIIQERKKTMKKLNMLNSKKMFKKLEKKLSSIQK